MYVYVYGHMGAYVYGSGGLGSTYSAHSVRRQARKHLSYVALELHSYRILCARPDVLGPVLVLHIHTYTRSRHSVSLNAHTHTHKLCNIFCHLCSFSCSHVQDMKIFQSAFRSASLYTLT